MEVLTYTSCMDTAYVRESHPLATAWNKVQVLPFQAPESFGDNEWILRPFNQKQPLQTKSYLTTACLVQ